MSIIERIFGSNARSEKTYKLPEIDFSKEYSGASEYYEL